MNAISALYNSIQLVLRVLLLEDHLGNILDAHVWMNPDGHA